MRWQDSQRLSIVAPYGVLAVEVADISVRVDSKQDVGHIGLGKRTDRVGGLVLGIEQHTSLVFALHNVVV